MMHNVSNRKIYEIVLIQICTAIERISFCNIGLKLIYLLKMFLPEKLSDFNCYCCHPQTPNLILYATLNDITFEN